MDNGREGCGDDGGGSEVVGAEGAVDEEGGWRESVLEGEHGEGW